MSVQYQRYLAEKVIDEKEVVTHRALSRALNVHTDHAKRMLFAFHQSQNKITPHSITATYLIKGIRCDEQFVTGAGNGECRVPAESFTSWMSSPPVPDADDRIRLESVLIVREQELEVARKQFNKIHTMFVYSIQAGPLLDINLLTDICVKSPADPLQHGKTWGIIFNPHVRRRTVPSSAWQSAAHPRPDPTKQSNPAFMHINESRIAAAQDRTGLHPKKDRSKLTWKSDSLKTAQLTEQPLQSTSAKPANSVDEGAESKVGAEPVVPKKGGGDLFQAFAKSKPKQTSAAPNPAAARPFSGSDAPSGNVTPDVKEDDNDIFLEDADDDEGEEPEEIFAARNSSEPGSIKTTESKRDTRQEREEKLRMMMENDVDEDQEMRDADIAASEMNVDESTPASDKAQSEPPSAQPFGSASRSNESAEAESIQEKPAPPGRHRGRRQVTKKRTTKDAEGYLVTTEERVWESFSEDEEPPRKEGTAVAQGNGTQGGRSRSDDKPKPKPKGQGSIMSFFAKKS
ncbi:hypothetical protein KEM54_006981 [Ascosphaera aggregata]|nr:hypothetical protein KEM54_006981 [Ascosphaera aggregata]